MKSNRCAVAYCKETPLYKVHYRVRDLYFCPAHLPEKKVCVAQKIKEVKP